MEKDEMVEMLYRSVKEWNEDRPVGTVNLVGVNLVGANLRRANLGGANLGRANLGRADLGRADLGEADLVEADLGGANLVGANLRRANLGGANLGGANLRGANLVGANLGGAMGIIQIGPVDGWLGNAVIQADGNLQVNFGCRSFKSRVEAANHWNGKYSVREGHDRIMMVGVDALVMVARAMGWEFEF